MHGTILLNMQVAIRQQKPQSTNKVLLHFDNNLASFNWAAITMNLLLLDHLVVNQRDMVTGVTSYRSYYTKQDNSVQWQDTLSKDRPTLPKAGKLALRSSIRLKVKATAAGWVSGVWDKETDTGTRVTNKNEIKITRAAQPNHVHLLFRFTPDSLWKMEQND